jgi:hypothetical protein
MLAGFLRDWVQTSMRSTYPTTALRMHVEEISEGPNILYQLLGLREANLG